jgi:hypothetical protein
MTAGARYRHLILGQSLLVVEMSDMGDHLL